jgi:lipopolysaccharide transport protein LptA
VRRGLLALVLVVSSAVGWNLLRPAPPAAPVASPPPASAAGTTVGEMSFLRFRDDSRRVQVKAREMSRGEGDTMLLKGVEAVLPFVRDGRPGTATIAADECQYQPGLDRAAFKGNVRVRTDDGFELESERLKHWGDEQRVFTGDPLRFRRGAMSGSALGLEYRKGSGALLKGAVRVRIEGASEPVEIESDSATAVHETRILTFTDSVVVRQGARELRSAELRLDLSQDLGAIERALATGSVDMLAGAGAALPGASLAQAAGARRLRSQRLEIGFRAKGVLQQALASGAASLELEPGPLEPQERRRVRAERLRFDFDAEGRLVSVHGLKASAGRGGARPRAVLTAEPLVASAGTPRRVECDGFEAQLDALSGELTGAEFDGSVAFEEPGRRAFAAHASSDQRAGTLVLTGEPRVVDEGEGSELRGREIRVATRTRGLSASGNVRHSVGGKGRSRPGLFGGPEPTVFLCREFEFDPATRTARYRDNAVVRSGSDELRAPLVTLFEPAPGERRMSATGGVVSQTQPRAAAGAAKQPAAVETRSREAQYTEAANRIVYSGEVEIRQGDILTRSPEATVLLAADGATLDRMLAGKPVEVRQGARRATGERGTYTPANESFVLTGERVVLHDVDRRLEGRILTFQVGSDRIRVDGREEVRTEAVFKRKEPPQP